MHLKSLIALTFLGLTIGCENTELPQPLTARAVSPQSNDPGVSYQNSTSAVDGRQASADSGGALSPAVEKGAAPATPAPEITAPQTATPQIDKSIKDVVTPPTSRPMGFNSSLESYQTIGAVVTNVSGTPIYADKVIASLAPLLKSEAKQRDLDTYKSIAHSEIDKQVQAMINNELEYAAAEQSLGKEEKDIAQSYTEQWRARQITEAGGSLEVARRKAQADGTDFDEMVTDEYRKVFVQLFYQKKVFPKVEVTAQDLRNYYDQHLKDQFTDTSAAKFRVIKITTKNMGSRAAAIDKINQLHAQAVRGDDFEKLAHSINHDPALMRSGGLIGGGDGWVQKGSYAVTPVEDAAWKLQPGQITDVIEYNDAFYIAKLEDRKLGKVQAFESEEVQNKIKDLLTREQMTLRRDQLRKRLIENSVIYPDPPETNAVMEIAMQKYPEWARK